jgi:hypothetical protein
MVIWPSDNICLQSPTHVHTFYIIYISLISINSSNNFSRIHLHLSFHTLGVHLPCPFVVVSSSILLVPIPSVFSFVCHFCFLVFVIHFEFISYLMIYSDLLDISDQSSNLVLIPGKCFFGYVALSSFLPSKGRAVP